MYQPKLIFLEMRPRLFSVISTHPYCVIHNNARILIYLSRQKRRYLIIIVIVNVGIILI